MSELTSIHRGWAALAVFLSLAINTLAGTREWPLRPLLEVPYVAVAGIPSFPGSAQAKKALADSRGDGEWGKIVLHVTRRDESYVETYKGTRFAMEDSSFRTPGQKSSS